MSINQNSRVETEWVSLREAAKIYAISTYTLRRRIASGQLPVSSSGRRILRVRPEAVDAMLRPFWLS